MSTKMTELTPAKVRNLGKDECIDVLAEMGMSLEQDMTAAKMREAVRLACVSYGYFEPDEEVDIDSVDFQATSMEGMTFKEKGKDRWKPGFEGMRFRACKLTAAEMEAYIEETSTHPAIQQPGREFNWDKAKQYGRMMLTSDIDMTAKNPFIVANITDRLDITMFAILDGQHRFKGAQHVMDPEAFAQMEFDCLLYDCEWIDVKRELLRINSDMKYDRTDGVITSCIKAAFDDPAMAHWTYGRIARWIVCDVALVSRTFGAMYHSTGRPYPKYREGIIRGKKRWWPVAEVAETMQNQWKVWAEADRRSELDKLTAVASRTLEEAQEVPHESLAGAGEAFDEAAADVRREAEMRAAFDNQEKQARLDAEQREQLEQEMARNGSEAEEFSLSRGLPGGYELTYHEDLVMIAEDGNASITVRFQDLNNFCRDVVKQRPR